MRKKHKKVSKLDIMRELLKLDDVDFCLSEGECCNTCTWDYIHDTYGDNAKGVWIKYYMWGGNACAWKKQEYIYIAHDLTKEQMNKLYNILLERFDVEWGGDENSCFIVHNGSVEQEAYTMYCKDTIEPLLFAEFIKSDYLTQYKDICLEERRKNAE